VTRFAAYIGIDYSGAAGPTDRVPGLRCYEASAAQDPIEIVAPGTSPRWSRATLAAWLEQRLRTAPAPVLVGIDHGFSAPLEYFSYHQIPREWDQFLDDFVAHWPSHRASVQSLREGNPRDGQSTWRRHTERRVRGAKSIFHFDVQGAVAKSTHAGLPWLQRLRRALPSVHLWPFDGWEPTTGASVVAEVFPTIARDLPAPAGLTPDQRDAYVVAQWLRQADANGTLTAAFHPALTPVERAAAAAEGWILGVGAGQPQ